MNSFDENWDELAGKLRKEIEAYGKLFELLEEQKSQFLKKDVDGINQINETMTDQTSILHGLKQEREALVQNIWERSNGNEKPITVKELLKHSPHESWPMFEELLGEVNRLILASQRQLEKNQMLLRRSWEIGQRFLQMLVPEEATASTVYGANGASHRSNKRSPMTRYRKQA